MGMTRRAGETQEIKRVEDMPAIARSIVSDYCTRNEIDESDIFPTVWNDIITELCYTLFLPNKKLLKLEGSQYGEYDKRKVFFIYEQTYKRLCNSHCQEVTLKGFCDMIGIPKQTFYLWDEKYNSIINSGGVNSINANSNIGDSDELSIVRIDLHKKIMEDNEESLFALMKDRRVNPMKILPKLNKVHGWNMSGVSAQATKQALTDAELPKLGTGRNCVDNNKLLDVVSDGNGENNFHTIQDNEKT